MQNRNAETSGTRPAGCALNKAWKSPGGLWYHQAEPCPLVSLPTLTTQVRGIKDEEKTVQRLWGTRAPYAVEDPIQRRTEPSPWTQSEEQLTTTVVLPNGDGDEIMTPPSSLRSDVRRWMLTVIAVAVSTDVLMRFGIVFTIFSSFPKEFVGPTCAFVGGFCVVLIASVSAPHYPAITGVVSCLYCTAYVAYSLCCVASREPIWPLIACCFIGGVLSVVYTTWRYSAARTPRSTRWVKRATALALAIYLAAFYYRYADYGEVPDPLPYELAELFRDDEQALSAFYLYDRGGFLDDEYLWCIEAKPEVIERIIGHLELQPANDIPGGFLRMPPHYWPRTVSADSATYRSEDFPTYGRGPDGDHYFMLFDRSRDKAFVWLKANF